MIENLYGRLKIKKSEKSNINIYINLREWLQNIFYKLYKKIIKTYISRIYTQQINKLCNIQ